MFSMNSATATMSGTTRLARAEGAVISGHCASTSAPYIERKWMRTML
jgi:hypothetical protein